MTLSRRTFLSTGLGACGALAGWGAGLAAAPAAADSPRVRALTRGPKHHFFGYYAICPWNRDGSLVACLECDRQDRMPLPGEAARVGVADATTGDFTPLADTRD